LQSSEWTGASSEVKDFISKMMEFNFEKRLSAKEALQHPWIVKKVKTTFDADMSKTALGNLKNFTAEAKLKQAAITFMTTHLSTKEERMQLKQSF